MKYASKEGAAAYGYEGYFKVPSVMIVTAMLDSTSKNKQQKRDSGRQSEFGQILAKETERLKEEPKLEGKVLSYTRNGQTFFGQTISRVYN